MPVLPNEVSVYERTNDNEPLKWWREIAGQEGASDDSRRYLRLVELEHGESA